MRLQIRLLRFLRLLIIRQTGVVGIAALSLLFAGCPGCPYSFTGASVPPHLNTIAIPNAVDQSGNADPAFRDELSRQLSQKFISDNTLSLSDRNSADCVLETVLTNVSDAPVTVEAGEQVRKRRITLNVRVVFTDLKLRKKVWEKDFSNNGDYDAQGGNAQRIEGAKEAIRKLTEDILLETVSGW
jgi:hypothetical protein